MGDEVEVYVLNVDRDRKRIGLSMKRLEDDPWSTIAERYQVDQLVEGTVTKLVKFGAFARIFDDDIEGLIHLSELSEERISHPREVVQEGDVRTLRVIRIDPGQRRIGLSLKRVASSEYVDVDWQQGYEQASEHDGAAEDSSDADEATVVGEAETVAAVAAVETVDAVEATDEAEEVDAVEAANVAEAADQQEEAILAQADSGPGDAE